MIGAWIIMVVAGLGAAANLALIALQADRKAQSGADLAFLRVVAIAELLGVGIWVYVYAPWPAP